MNRNEIYRIKTKNLHADVRFLLDEADLASEILQKTGIFNAAAKILIKPNLVTPSPADFGATTHVEIVEEIIRYLLEKGYSNITVAEGSWVGDKTEEAFDICGYFKLAEKYGVRLIDTKKEKSKITNCSGMELEICSCGLSSDFLINVPVLKGHCQTKMTCALKNMKGLIPDREKRRFHKLGLHDPIAHLNMGIRQDFILVDDICGDPDFEEGGNPGNHGCILAAKDPVLVDAYACEVLGWKTEEIPYLIKAQELGVGSMSDMTVRDIGEILSQQMLSAGRRILDVSYAVDESETCSACYSSLTEALWRLKEEKLLEKLPGTIGIGQGMRGKKGVFGIGNCTSGFNTFVKGCPPDSDDIYRSLKKYISENS